MPLPSDNVGEGIMLFGLSVCCVRSSWTGIVTTISHERLEQFFYKTDREYLLLSDDLLDSGVKGQGRSRPWRWRRHPRGRWGVEFRLLVEYNMILLIYKEYLIAA